MKWILVYIVVNGMEPVAVNGAGPNVTFNTMFECFEFRENLVKLAGGLDGYFPPNMQGVCIQIKDS